MKNVLVSMFSNPEGGYSTKRIAGWVCLIFACIFGVKLIFFPVPPVGETIALGVFYGFLGAFLGALGISSFDANNYFKNNQTQNTTNTNNTNN